MKLRVLSLSLAGACACLLAFVFTRSDRVVAAPATAAAPAAAAERPIQPGRITLSAASDEALVGSVESHSGAMSFRARGVDATGRAARAGTTPARVQVRLEINGAVLDHTFDEAAGTLVVHAAERATIAEGDREVLRSFHQELGRSLTARGDMKRMPKPHDVLWRLAEMYAEVPVGRVFEGDWVIRRGTSEPVNQPIAQEPTIEERLSAPQPQGELTIAACNERGGGSFTNLKSIANVCDDDIRLYRYSYHDYCPSHGYSGRSVGYGCGHSACPGRCGPGCGVADGVGAWYQDCLDHDICNRDHNSQLGACGDEWTEAADDYAFGAISCYTTCG